MNTASPIADELYQQAVRYADLNRYQEWMDYCNRALAIDPHHVPTLVLRGQGYVETGNPQTALADFETAIRLDPRHGRAYYGRAWVRGLLGDLDGEIEDATRAMQCDASLTLLYYRRLGHAYAAKGDINRAIEYYNKVLDVEPNNTGTLYNRASLYLGLHKHDQALSDLNRILRFQPTWGWALRDRGRVYMALGEFQKALDDFNRAIRYAPDEADSYYWRGQCYERLNNRDLARQDYDQAARLDPSYRDFWQASE